MKTRIEGLTFSFTGWTFKHWLRTPAFLTKMAAVGCQQWHGEHASPTTQARAQSNTDVFIDTNPRTTAEFRDNN